MAKQKADHRLIHILACSEMVLSTKLPRSIRKQIDAEKGRVIEQAYEFGEHRADEAMECLLVGVMLIDDQMRSHGQARIDESCKAEVSSDERTS